MNLLSPPAAGRQTTSTIDIVHALRRGRAMHNVDASWMSGLGAHSSTAIRTDAEYSPTLPTSLNANIFPVSLVYKHYIWYSYIYGKS